jgi:DNA repair exonuclease SbcCD ATPase subunit
MNQEQAYQLWESLYGDVDTAYDYASHLMRKSDFDNENSIVGWTVDYKKPLTQGGSYLAENLIPCSFSTFRLREGKNAFAVGSHKFEVRKGRRYGTFEIYDITDRNNPLNLNPEEFNQDPEFNRARKKDISSSPNAGFDRRMLNINSVYRNALRKELENIEFEDKPEEEEKEEAPLASTKAPKMDTTSVTDAFVKEHVLEPSSIVGEAIPAMQEEAVEEETRVEKEPVAEEQAVEDIPIKEVEEPADTEKPESDEIEKAPVEEPTEENAVESVAEEVPVEEETMEEIPMEESFQERLEEPVEKPVEEKPVEEKPVEEQASEEKVSEPSELDELKTQLALKDKEIQQLNDRLLELDDKVEEKEENGEIEEDFERVDATPEVDYIAEIDKLNAEINALKEQLSSEKEKSEKLDQETQNLLSDFTNANVRADALASQLEQYQNLRPQLDEKSGEILALQKQLAKALGEVEGLKAEAENKENKEKLEKDELLSQIEALNAEKKELDSKIETLSSEVNDKDNDEQLKEDAIHELHEKIASLEQEKNTLENQVTEDMNRLHQTLAEKDQEIENLNLLLQDRETALGTMTQKVSELDINRHNSDTTILNLNQNIESKDDEIKNLRAELVQKNEELAKKNQALENQDAVVESLNQDIASKQVSLEALQGEKKALEDKLQVRDNEITALKSKVEELNQQLQIQSEEKGSVDGELTSARDELEHLRAEKNALQEQFDELQANFDMNEETKQHVEANFLSIDAKRKELENALAEKNKAYDELLAESQKNQISANEQIEDLNIQLNASEKREMVLKEGARAKFLDDVLAYLDENKIEYSSANIQEALLHNATWLSLDEKEIGDVPQPTESSVEEVKPLVAEVISSEEEDVSLIDEERGRRKRAEDYFDSLYGEETNMISDFAGRFFRKTDYNNKASRYGWSYALLDKNKPEDISNVVLAHLKTLEDFRSEGSFTSNGHAYEVVTEGNRTFVHSVDYVTDPFDYEQAMKVTSFNEQKKSPIIYIFVKAISVSGNDAQKENVLKFFDLIDRTVKRCCPESFIEMKTKLGAKTDYAFITFDGGVDGAYKETMDYALILNAYRQKFNKEGLLNAIIVINQLEVPFSMRHLTLDRLIMETGDKELMALRYELLMTSVINSLILKTIHIGPSIVDKVPINKAGLRESRLAQGNFARAYGFSKSFQVYNFGYSLKHKVDEQ